LSSYSNDIARPRCIHPSSTVPDPNLSTIHLLRQQSLPRSAVRQFVQLNSAPAILVLRSQPSSFFLLVKVRQIPWRSLLSEVLMLALFLSRHSRHPTVCLIHSRPLDSSSPASCWYRGRSPRLMATIWQEIRRPGMSAPQWPPHWNPDPWPRLDVREAADHGAPSRSYAETTGPASTRFRFRLRAPGQRPGPGLLDPVPAASLMSSLEPSPTRVIGARPGIGQCSCRCLQFMHPPTWGRCGTVGWVWWLSALSVQIKSDFF